MPSQRFLRHAVAASLFVGLAACGGTTTFQGAQAFTVAGTPPPAPPPPKIEAAKPPPRVELRDNKITIRDKIQFEVNKSDIKSESFSLMKEIADVIKKNPQIKKLSIEGHASSEGDPGYNKRLSQARAKAVMTYLVQKEGIDANKLSSKGWGAEKPIADNATEDGREKNRRVEFLVTEQDVTKKKVEIDPKTGKEKVIEEKKESVKAPTAPASTTAKKTTATPALKAATKATVAPKTAPTPAPTTEKK